MEGKSNLAIKMLTSMGQISYMAGPSQHFNPIQVRAFLVLIIEVLLAPPFMLVHVTKFLQFFINFSC